jgi:hypothetical protein
MRYLTVGDLIEELKKFPKDTQVAVQYRDSGGEYYGSDDEIYLTIDSNGTLLL